MENTKKIFHFIRKNILDAILPISCTGCNSKGSIICDTCINAIQQTDRKTEDNIYACFDYRNQIIKKIIWDLKYYHRFSIGEKLGKILYENMIEELSQLELYTQGSPILVIPVPISKSRNRNRGYNQAEKIAKGFCNSSNKKILILKSDIVIKTKDTLPQAKVTDKNKRLRNIHNAFSINKKYKDTIKDKTIIIIDDVTTTGGTIMEIMRVLKKNGAKKIIGMAVAH